MSSFTGRVLLLFVFIAGAYIGAVTGQEPDSTGSTASYGDMELLTQVRGIFSRSCATGGCHSGSYPKMKLNLEAGDLTEMVVDVPSIQNPERKLADSANPAASYLLIKVIGGEEMKGKFMPINLPPLTDDEISTVAMWIESLGDTTKADSTETEKKSP